MMQSRSVDKNKFSGSSGLLRYPGLLVSVRNCTWSEIGCCSRTVVSPYDPTMTKEFKGSWREYKRMSSLRQDWVECQRCVYGMGLSGAATRILNALTDRCRR